MADLIEKFRDFAKSASAKDKADAVKVIEEQIEMTMSSVQDAAPHLVGHTEAYRNLWIDKVEKLRAELTQLEQVKKMLRE